jgi:hypothetical protein
MHVCNDKAQSRHKFKEFMFYNTHKKILIFHENGFKILYYDQINQEKL